MYKKIIFFIAIFSCLLFLFGCIESNTSIKNSENIQKKRIYYSTKNETQKLCQIVIDLPKIQEYYHSNISERIPLNILINKFINGSFPLYKFGTNVNYISESKIGKRKLPFLEFCKINIDATNAYLEKCI